MRAAPLLLTVALFGFGLRSVALESIHDKIREGLPRYDPRVREEKIAESDVIATADAPTAQPAASAPDRLSITTANTTPVVLPEVVVTMEQPKQERPKPLPRVESRPAPGKARLEPFLTPEERDARLEEKHLTALDRKVLNRVTLPLFGVSKKERARQAEAVERGARAVNEVANHIERAQLAGADPGYIRELEKLYYQAYLSRPK